MKYCTHCGKENSEDAVVCINCGIPVAEENQSVKAKKSNSKAIIVIISVLSVVLVTASIFGIVFVPKIIKINKIEKALVGETLSYTKNYYYQMYYHTCEYEFISNNKVNYSYYYSSNDLSGEYEADYKIKVVSDNEILLIIDNGGAYNEFLLDFNDDGSVKSMTNINDSEEVYE